jgi:transposase
MVWTVVTRGDYARENGAYASDVTDREWRLIAPHLPSALLGGRPRTTLLREVVNAIFYLLQTGCQWRMLPRDFPPRSTIYGYFRSWIDGGSGHMFTMFFTGGAAIWKGVRKARPLRLSTAKASKQALMPVNRWGMTPERGSRGASAISSPTCSD